MTLKTPVDGAFARNAPTADLSGVRDEPSIDVLPVHRSQCPADPLSPTEVVADGVQPSFACPFAVCHRATAAIDSAIKAIKHITLFTSYPPSKLSAEHLASVTFGRWSVVN